MCKEWSKDQKTNPLDADELAVYAEAYIKFVDYLFLFSLY